MLRLYKIENGLIREMPFAEGQYHDLLDNADWIDIHDPDDSERLILERMLLADLPESDEIEEIEASARLFVDQAGLHVHALFLSQTEGRYVPVTVACILQPKRLITFRESDIPDFRLLRMRARRGQIESLSPASLLVTLFEQKVENHADQLEDIHRRLENVSYLVLEDEEAELETAISQLAKLEDSNGKIRLCLMDTQRDISFLLRNLRGEAVLADDMREIVRDVEALLSHTTFLFEKINFLMDSTQGFISIEQSKVIKIFSIVAVVFLPPTLVASSYGMNFMHMPELEWALGYPWAIGLMIVSGIAPYLIFKWKGLL